MTMDSLRLHFPYMTDEEEVWLRDECLRRAALGFEEAQLWRDAAECWADLGQYARAGELYARHGDRLLAADALLQAGHYAEALAQYNAHAATLSDGQVAGQVRVLLGQAACHLLATSLPTAQPPSPAFSARTSRELYRRARALLESRFLPGVAGGTEGGRSWQALAEYGLRLNRYDLVQEGYEQALAHYGPSGERVAACRASLQAARDWDDRLLTRALEERLAEWGGWEERPGWHAQRDTIEGYAFRAPGYDLQFPTADASPGMHDLRPGGGLLNGQRG